MANNETDIRKQMEERLMQKKSRIENQGQPTEKPGLLKRLSTAQLHLGVSKREVATFARELALLQDLGVSLIRALNILYRRVHNPALSKLVKEMRETVELGGPLSDALGKHRFVFGEFFISAVKAGEESGELASTLNHLADYLDKQDGIQKRIKRALALPVITLVIAMGVTMMLFAYIIPMFADVYTEAGIELPQLTEMVLFVGKLINMFWWIGVLALVFLILLFYRSGKVLGLETFSDRLKLSIPIVRGVTQRLVTFRFARLMSTMMKAGVHVLPTLRLAGPATGNTVIAKRIERACHHIDQGKTISGALAEEQVFSPMITDAISVGEEVGSVGTVLDKLAEYSERDVEDMVANLSTILEPLMTLVMGVLVLIIALSLFLPYFNMNQVLMQ